MRMAWKTIWPYAVAAIATVALVWLFGRHELSLQVDHRGLLWARVVHTAWQWLPVLLFGSAWWWTRLRRLPRLHQVRWLLGGAAFTAAAFSVAPTVGWHLQYTWGDDPFCPQTFAPGHPLVMAAEGGPVSPALWALIVASYLLAVGVRARTQPPGYAARTGLRLLIVLAVGGALLTAAHALGDACIGRYRCLDGLSVAWLAREADVAWATGILLAWRSTLMLIGTAMAWCADAIIWSVDTARWTGVDRALDGR